MWIMLFLGLMAGQGSGWASAAAPPADLQASAIRE